MVRRDKKPKLASTAVDALVVALSPALIIGMISCLVFFLVLAFYQGQYDQRLMYILGLYTIAVVLIARIAIESGRAYAMTFSLPLALATIVAMAKFVTIRGLLEPMGWVLNVALLAVAWYLADRITFDCTLMNEREQGVQQGLLQSLGLFKKEVATGRDATPKKRSGMQGKKHNPGVWVLYFSLLAFPLFGLGQLFIADEMARDRAFYFLVGYLACGLGLLVTTSFVNMRRYLRHRGVAMPPEMSRAWLGYGITGIFVVLALCMVLPLPGRSLGLVGLPFEFKSPDGLQGKRGGWGNEGSQIASGKDASAITSDDAEEQGNAAQPDGKGPPKASDNASSDSPKQASESGDSNNQRADDGEQAKANEKANADNSQDRNPDTGSDQSDNKDGSQEKADASDGKREQAGREKPNANKQGDAESQKKNVDADAAARQQQQPNAQTPPQNSATPTTQNPASWLQPLMENIGTLMKWGTIVVLAVIVLVYSVTHYRELARLWRDLLNFFRLGSKSRAEVSETQAATSQSRANVAAPKFQQFANPFSSGASWTPDKVVEHTFSALEAWAAERGAGRKGDQTATEFAAQLSRKSPKLKTHATHVATMLNEQSFGGRKPNDRDVAPLAELWNVMQNNP